jgi:hypothetical protein
LNGKKKNNDSNWEATPARWDDGEPAESEFEQFMEHHLRDVKQRLCAYVVLGSSDPNNRTKQMEVGDA